MPTFKRELAFEADRPGVNRGDWWHLELDTDARGIYVEHTWHHESVYREGETSTGAQRFGINDFLTLAQDRPAHAALISALTEMFQDAKES